MQSDERCTHPGCDNKPYGRSTRAPLNLTTCKLHTPCSEDDCARMVGRHGGAPSGLGRQLCKSHLSRWQLYGSTGEHVRKPRADRGSYRVPDRLEDSIAGHPRLGPMFLRNLDIPARGARELTLAALNECEWACPTNPDHPPFAATPNQLSNTDRPVTRHRADGTAYTYVNPGSGCPPCGEETRGNARRRSNARKLAAERPELAAQFVENLTTPGLGFDDIAPRSRDLVRWRCACGETVDRTPEKVPFGSFIFCRSCRRPGESLLEWHTAALVEACTGLQVDKQHVVDGWKVDIHLPDLGWSFDLDPHYTHQLPSRRDTDAKKSLALDDIRYSRIREAPLTALGRRDVVLPEGSRVNAFANTIIDQVAAIGHDVRPATFDVVRQTLADTMTSWSTRPGTTLRQARPDLHALVVGCLDDPNLEWASMPVHQLRPLRFRVRCRDGCQESREVHMKGWLESSGRCRKCRPLAAA